MYCSRDSKYLIVCFLCIWFVNIAAAQSNMQDNLHIMTAIDQSTPSDVIDCSLLNIVRIPNAIVTNRRTLFVTANTVEIDGVSSNGLIARSTDNGDNWQVKPFEHKMPKGFLYDKENDAIFFLNHVRAWRSTDDGETFDEYAHVGIRNPLDSLFFVLRENEKQRSIQQRYAYELTMSTSPCLGIQLSNGVLVMPFKASIRKWKAIPNQLDDDGYPVIDRSKVKNIIDILADVCILAYSRDYGKTWEQSPSTPLFNTDGTPCIIDEVSIAEVEENRVMINARGGTESWLNQTNLGRRVLYQTNNSIGIKKEDYTIAGFEFDPISDGVLWDPLVHAAFAKCEYNNTTFWLFCNCYLPGEYKPRKDLMLQVSADGHHWTPVMLVSPAGKEINGYCSIYCNNNTIILSYEDSGSEGIKVINLTESCIDRIMEAYQENVKLRNLTTPAKKKKTIYRLLKYLSYLIQ